MTHKFNFTSEQLEIVDNMVSYYLDRFSVESIQEKHPGFVVEDFEKVLNILKTVTEQEAW